MQNNITKGVTPAQLTTWIVTIAHMAGSKNEGGSGSYKSMSGYWGTQFANIAWAYSHSEPGLRHQQKTGSNPYCLAFICKIATDDVLLDKIITDLVNEIVQGRLVSEIVSNADLINAMRLVNINWINWELASETKMSIQDSLVHALNSVLSNHKLNRLFFEGRDSLNQVDEHGNEIDGESGDATYLPNIQPKSK